MFIFSPVPTYEYLIPFGYYRDEKTDELKFSNGVVYDGILDILSPQDSIVEESGFNSKWGGYLLLKHADDLYTFYAHGNEAPPFQVGDRVDYGQHIFNSSDQGEINRPQFYFEVRTQRDGGQVDPGSYIFPGGVVPGILPPPQAKLDVNGLMDKETWKAFQLALKCNATFAYMGIVDGIPGPLTWKSIKESVGLLFNETGVGTEEEEIIKGIQRKLYSQDQYFGLETGEFDKETVSALQRVLNLGKY